MKDWHNNNWVRVLVIVVLIVTGLCFGNAALFNAWQTAFPGNEPYLDTLKIRFWVYSILFILCILFSIILTVLTIKRINRAFRKKHAK